MERDDPWDIDTAVLDNVAHLIGSALRRQVWIFPLDDTTRAIACIALEDLPVDPDPQDVERFAGMLAALLQQSGAESVVLVWERPGGPEMRMQEADWVAGMAESGVPLRAQLLAHDDGCRILDPEFEALVA